MRAFASDLVLIEGGAVYLRYVGISYFILSISQVYLTIMKNCEKVAMCAAISFASVVINIVFNALLIFGIGPFPEFGIAGVAIATVISKVVELVWALIIMFMPGNVKIRLKYILKGDKILQGDFWKYTLHFRCDYSVCDSFCPTFYGADSDSPGVPSHYADCLLLLCGGQID